MLFLRKKDTGKNKMKKEYRWMAASGIFSTHLMMHTDSAACAFTFCDVYTFFVFGSNASDLSTEYSLRSSSQTAEAYPVSRPVNYSGDQLRLLKIGFS